MDWQKVVQRLRRDVLQPIKETLVGKDEIVEVLGVAVAAGENVFLLGPPGTAKSAIVAELAGRLDGRTFDYLLTRFTEPSELFGPFDLRALRDGDLITNTDGMLPEADFVFLDELLNANSAILNSLLLALNERIFRRGRETVKLPMLLTVGASNNLPQDDALGALFDRFLLRVPCENVPDDRLDQVLRAGWKREQRAELRPTLSVDDVRVLQSTVLTIDVQGVQPAYLDLVGRLRRAGLPISDRRAVRLQRVIAASAMISGRAVADVSDLWTMRYIWEAPPQIEILQAHIDAVRKQYGENDQMKESSALHPMAERNLPPDPETLAAQVVSLLEAKTAEDRAAAGDQLSLLAARVEWVPEEAARKSLRERIVMVREMLAQETPAQE